MVNPQWSVRTVARCWQIPAVCTDTGRSTLERNLTSVHTVREDSSRDTTWNNTSRLIELKRFQIQILTETTIICKNIIQPVSMLDKDVTLVIMMWWLVLMLNVIVNCIVAPKIIKYTFIFVLNLTALIWRHLVNMSVQCREMYESCYEILVPCVLQILWVLIFLVSMQIRKYKYSQTLKNHKSWIINLHLNCGFL